MQKYSQQKKTIQETIYSLLQQIHPSCFAIAYSEKIVTVKQMYRLRYIDKVIPWYPVLRELLVLHS